MIILATDSTADTGADTDNSIITADTDNSITGARKTSQSTHQLVRINQSHRQPTHRKLDHHNQHRNLSSRLVIITLVTTRVDTDIAVTPTSYRPTRSPQIFQSHPQVTAPLVLHQCHKVIATANTCTSVFQIDTDATVI